MLPSQSWGPRPKHVNLSLLFAASFDTSFSATAPSPGRTYAGSFPLSLLDLLLTPFFIPRPPSTPSLLSFSLFLSSFPVLCALTALIQELLD